MRQGRSRASFRASTRRTSYAGCGAMKCAAVPQVPVSEFPSFQGPSVGPRKDHAFQFPKLFLHSRCTDSWILLRKFQIPRFRVCRFQDIPGQIPDSVFPSFRGPLLGPSPREHLRSTTPKFQIPSFRVSEVPSSVQGRGTPKSPQIPDSEFPSFRGPLLALGSQQEGLANSQIPSFRV